MELWLFSNDYRKNLHPLAIRRNLKYFIISVFSLFYFGILHENINFEHYVNWFNHSQVCYDLCCLESALKAVFKKMYGFALTHSIFVYDFFRSFALIRIGKAYLWEFCRQWKLVHLKFVTWEKWRSIASACFTFVFIRIVCVILFDLIKNLPFANFLHCKKKKC